VVVTSDHPSKKHTIQVKNRPAKEKRLAGMEFGVVLVTSHTTKG
jgi:hypothetical protein